MNNSCIFRYSAFSLMRPCRKSILLV
jgi:hypothetical protein